MLSVTGTTAHLYSPFTTERSLPLALGVGVVSGHQWTLRQLVRRWLAHSHAPGIVCPLAKHIPPLEAGEPALRLCPQRGSPNSIDRELLMRSLNRTESFSSPSPRLIDRNRFQDVLGACQ